MQTTKVIKQIIIYLTSVLNDMYTLHRVGKYSECTWYFRLTSHFLKASLKTEENLPGFVWKQNKNNMNVLQCYPLTINHYPILANKL